MNYYTEVKKLKVLYGDDPVTRQCYQDIMKVFLSYVTDLEQMFIDIKSRSKQEP